jgi:uncharacterized protein
MRVSPFLALLAFALPATASETEQPNTVAIAGTPVPLIEAARRGDVDAVTETLSGGADVASQDGLGRTALHYAAALGYTDIVAVLTSDAGLVDAQDGDGFTPLMRAAQNGHHETVRRLLDHGARADLKNQAGLTAADLARAGEHPDIAALFE